VEQGSGRVPTQRVVALAFAVACVAYFWIALGLSWGSATRPGPGFFPRLSAVLALVLAAVAFALAAPLARPEQVRGAWPASLALLAFCLLLQPLGFVVAGTLLAALLARLLGARTAWQVAAVSIPAPLLLHLLFSRLFEIKLPAGVLRGWI
jgi:putative tricarboxylic transport membrane protein